MEQKSVADKIKSLIATRAISIEQLSELSMLDTHQLNQILENDKIPSLATLIKIARALGVRPGTFIDDVETDGPVVKRLTDIQKPASFSSQLSDKNPFLDFFALAGNKAGRNMEPFIIQIKPSENSEPIFSSHEGEEFLYVLHGSVEVTYGKQIINLQTGDSIYYDSIVDHYISTHESKPAQILAIVYSPF